MTFVVKKRRVSYQFNEEYELNYYIGSIEKDIFVGLISSVKKNGDYIFQNKQLNEFIFSQKIQNNFLYFLILLSFGIFLFLIIELSQSQKRRINYDCFSCFL